MVKVIVCFVGGNYEIDGTEYPAALRYPNDDKEIYNTGFRPVIYK